MCSEQDEETRRDVEKKEIFDFVKVDGGHHDQAAMKRD